VEAGAPAKTAQDPTRSPAEMKSRCSEICRDRPKVGVGHRTSVAPAPSRAVVLSDSPNRHVTLGPPKPPTARPARCRQMTGSVGRLEVGVHEV
jgi:hypothetical protein